MRMQTLFRTVSGMMFGSPRRVLLKILSSTLVSFPVRVGFVLSLRLYHNALQCHFEAQGDRRNKLPGGKEMSP